MKTIGLDAVDSRGGRSEAKGEGGGTAFDFSQALVARSVACFLIAIATISGLACRVPSRALPPGQYDCLTCGDSLVVEGNLITFDMEVPDSVEAERIVRSYEYSVWEDGSINLVLYVSTDALRPPGMWRWQWDDGTIIRRERQTDDFVRFVPAATARNASGSPEASSDP